jgi:hypothetical protein
MNRRAFIGLLFGMAATVIVGAYGSVRRLVAGPTPTGGPQASASSQVTFVVRPGADPTLVGRRIAGPNATVSHAYPGRRPQENLPQGVILRSFVVNVPVGQAQEALQRARADPDVQLAYAGRPPGT